MIFKQFPAEERFENFIECFIYFKGYTPEHSIEKVIPDGSINLIFELDGIPRHTYDNETLEPNATFTKVWFAGFIKEYISISAHQDSEMFVIRFLPGGAFPFLREPVSNFTDKVIPAEQIFGDEIFEFRNTLLGHEDPEEKSQASYDWLDTRVTNERIPKPEIFDQIQKIIEDPEFQENNLTQLIDESGYSQKQFISLFKEYVGVAPKYFQRVIRFNELLLKIQKEETLSWTEISYECGFYDQAHFIKEFQHFCGYNPQAHLDTPLVDERTNFFPRN